MKSIFALAFTFLFMASTGEAQYSGSTFRKATLELRQADQGGQYVLNLEGPAPELQFDSVTKRLRAKLSSADAEYLTRLFKELPVVPKLPAECARDNARASFQPDDQRPRATCVSQDTAYSKKYRHLIRALDLALVKSAAAAPADAKPAAKPKGPTNDARD